MTSESNEPQPEFSSHPILSGSAQQISAEIRRAASECQNAVARLTEREQVDPNALAEFSMRMASVLQSVARERDLVDRADRAIKKLQTSDRDIRRYNQVRGLIQQASDESNFREEQRLRRELTHLSKITAPKMDQMRADIHTSLTHRLMLLRHWSWFVRQAIDFYEMLGEAIAINLFALRSILPPDDELVNSIDSLLSARGQPTPRPTIDPDDLPDDPQTIHGTVLRELSLLQETLTILEIARTESNELGNTEVLLQDEIASSNRSEESPISFAPFLNDDAPAQNSPPSPSTRRMVIQKRS